ncbi:DUF1685 family protein [Rhynchospora pubera]|uniref:DUF1685 family protein n=1 Tax=Rhynchospora pubera TaxID=906938 RepID=A0AAV8DUP7_9POAL|nr:DUF1685 family protein [Rhynchospora pubera]KAJ4788972.1 DUF1685 family protein [Rhynchospora pubera]
MEQEDTAITRNNFEDILSLFDLYWFHHLILFSHPPSTSTPVPTPTLPEVQTELISPVPSPLHHRRTRSDESMSSFLSPRVKPPSLETIFSGKESMYPTQSSQRHSLDIDSVMRKRQPHARMRRRSMSELEVEELKGLMDLGFNFSDTEVEKDPRIADIVPGLRKRNEGEVEVSRRPYLSEAWRVRDKEERRKVLRDWKVLANGDESQVKEQLRRWAHVVASTVR